ncbi:MAG: protein kinase [Planctomycetota bacterium]|nr:protein kinase [Planctomycetota bacterium]
MSPSVRRKCPVCGAPVPAGRKRCAKGHPWPAGSRPTAPADGCPADEELTPLACGEPIDAKVKEHVSSCARCRERLTGIREVLDALSGGDSAEQAPAGEVQHGENTLFECTDCERLVETQYCDGRYVVPGFCPWCGREVATIVGRELDGYQVDGLISQGGFGTIYLAANVTQPLMKSVVKILRPQVAYFRPEFIKVFLDEARVTESIGQTCWNIVRVSNVREKPWPYFFMEYIRGTTLETYISETSGKIPIPDCVGFLRGMVKGLAATHARGRVHRDLKPLNIMVIRSKNISQPEERIKMLDFGLAMKIASKGESLGLTDFSEGRSTVGGATEKSPVQSAGTPEYMPPEAFDGVNDFEGDIYSFGVTAYEVLAGQRPWRDAPPGTNRMFYWRNCHKNKPPKPVRAVRSGVPKWLSRVVMNCLAKDPLKRPPTADELLRRLRPPVPLWVWLASAAAVLLLTGLIGFAFTDRSPRSITAWRLDGKVLNESRPTVPVSGPDALGELQLAVRLHAPVGDVDWQVEPATVRIGEAVPEPSSAVSPSRLFFPVLFPEGEERRRALFRAPVVVKGWRGTLVKRLAFEGEFILRHDDAPPVFRRFPEGFVGRGLSGEDVDLGQNPRLRPDQVELRVTIDGDAVEAHLHTEPRPKNRGTLTGVRTEALDVWRFVLPSTQLVDGAYEAHVEARDAAGNTGTSEPFAFRVDGTCEFDVPGNKALVAGGKAFYPCEILEADEVLREVSVSVAGDPREVELFRSSSEADNSIDLLKADLEAVDLETLAPGEIYYLAFPLTRGRGDRTSVPVSITVRDAAVPEANLFTKELRIELPEPLADGDIERITLKVGDVSKEISGANLRRFLSKSRQSEETWSVAFPDPDSRTLTIDSLTVGLSRNNRVVRAESDPAAETTSTTATRVEFRGLEWPVNRGEDLAFTLYNGLEEPLLRYLSLRIDTQKAELTIRLRSNGEEPPIHRVETSADVQLVLSADEPLFDIKVSAGDATVDVRKRMKKAGSGGFELGSWSLEGLGLREGDYTLTVSGTDGAGIVSRKSEPFILDKNPPKLECTDSDLRGSDGVYRVVKRNRLNFRVGDPNGVDLGTLKFRIELKTGEIFEDVKPDLDRSEERVVFDERFALPLDVLPEACSGKILCSVADVHDEGREYSFPFAFDRRSEWGDVVEWHGLTWILFKDERGEEKFISATEISNRIYLRTPAHDTGRTLFVARDGEVRYRPEELDEYRRPMLWTKRGPPTYTRGREVVSGDEYPLMGISPGEAEYFAEEIFGARLPTYDEWVSAGQMGDPEVRYPFDLATGRKRVNHSGTDWKTTELTGEVDGRPRYADGVHLAGGGQSRNWVYVEVGLDLFRDDRADGEGGGGRSRSLRILHQLGNVAELVRLGSVRGRGRGPRKWRYGMAGGSFESQLSAMALDRRRLPEGYRSDTADRSWRTGFRLLLEPETAPRGFREKARIR